MLNDIALIGRLVRDPEMRRTGSGIAVCNFTLAVDEDYKGQDGQKETEFIECTAWRQAAEFAGKYLRKGAMASVRGRMKSQKWTDKDGNNRTKWFVRCDNVYSCESRKDASASQGQQDGNPAYGGYPAATYGGYSAPAAAGAPAGHYTAECGPEDFAMLEDDDANLPF